MDYLKDQLDRRMWTKEDGFESSYSNNMVTKGVEAYTRDNLVVLVSYTKTAGYSVELFNNDGLVNTLYYNGDIHSEEELEEELNNLIEEYDLNS